VRSNTKCGPDLFSCFDVYWIQTDTQTDKQAKYLYRFWFFQGEYFEFGSDSEPPRVYKREWRQQQFHYDNVAVAMLTLFAVQTTEGWPAYVSSIFIYFYSEGGEGTVLDVNFSGSPETASENLWFTTLFSNKLKTFLNLKGTGCLSQSIILKKNIAFFLKARYLRHFHSFGFFHLIFIF